MTEAVPVYLGLVAVDVAAQLLANLIVDVPVVHTAGGPACGWLTALELRGQQLWGSVRFVSQPSELSTFEPHINSDAVDGETGRHLGAEVVEVIATPGRAMAPRAHRVASRRHTSDFLALVNQQALRPNEQETDMATDVIRMGIAKERAAREGISLHTALSRVNAECDARARTGVLAARPVSTSPTQSAGTATVPPLPAGLVTLQQARVHLQEAMPGFAALNADAQYSACKTLRALCADPVRAQLSKQAFAKPTLLLALYPGASQRGRAMAYLSATTADWAKLEHDDQWQRAKTLIATHNVVDTSAAVAS